MITIGNYLSTNYTYVTGTTTVTAYGVPFKFDLSTVKKVELIRPNLTGDTMDTLLRAFSILYGNITPTTASSAPIAGTPTTGGSVNAGTHSYKITLVIGGYETLASSASNIVTTDVTNKTVTLTGIVTGPIATTARNIYRTNAGGSTYYYVGQVTGNTDTTFIDTTADNTTTSEPTSSLCYDFTWSSTLNGANTPTIETNDMFNIEVDVLDPSISYEMGYQSSQIINPIQLEYDSVFNLVTTQAFTTGWVVAGSAFSMEGRNVAKCYCLFTVGGLTSARFKIMGRHTAAGTLYPVDVSFDSPSRVTELEDSTNPLFKIYELNRTITQYFTFEILTDLAVSEVEIQILGIGTMTSSAFTVDVIKSYSPTNLDKNEQKDYEPKIIGSATDVVSGTTNYYPSSGGEILMGVNNISIQMVTSGGITTTFEISDDTNTWFNSTQLGVITGDNTIPSRVRTTNLSSFVNESIKVDIDNVNSKYFRIKSVSSSNSNNLLYLIKKRSF